MKVASSPRALALSLKKALAVRRRGDKCPVDIVLHGERSSLFDTAFPLVCFFFFLPLPCTLYVVMPVSFHSISREKVLEGRNAEMKEMMNHHVFDEVS